MMVAPTFISYLTALSVLPLFIQADHLSLNRRVHQNKRALPAGWSAQGCHTDDPTKRTLLGAYFIDAAANSPESCIHKCDTDGFHIAGVEFGQECMCGQFLANGIPAPLPECSTPCPGNPTTTCGAANRLNLFVKDGNLPPPPAPGSWAYIGCFADSVTARSLPDRQEVDGEMTVEKCTDKCRSGRYTFSGLEFRNECYCGNRLANNPTQTPDAQCDMTCSGNKSEPCGGGNRLTVYSLVAPSQEQGWKFIGCMKDTINARTLSVTVPVSGGLTPQKCQDECHNHGYNLAGTEYSKEVYCDNQLRNTGIKVSDGDCDMKCEGDPNQTCGGGNRIQVYFNEGDDDGC